MSIAPLILWYPVVIGRQFFGHADPGVQFIPFFQFYGSYIRSYGSIPLWNDYIFSGFPTYASVVGGFFYPLHLLYAFFPAREVYAWLLYLNFALAGIASVRLGRLLSLSRGGSLVAALAYIFCSQAIEWGVNNVYYIILWILPVVFVCLVEIAQYMWGDTTQERRPSRLRLLCAASLLTLSLAVGWLASAPQLLLYTLTVAAIAGFYLDISGRHRQRPKKPWYSLKVTYTLILCTVVATVIGLIQIIPSLRLLPFTARTGGLEYLFASRGAISIINFYRYLWPEYEIHHLADWSGVFLFIGALPLIFTLYAFRAWRKDWRVPFFATIFLFSLAAAIRWSPLKYLIFHAPIYNLFRGPARWMLWGSFGLAFLAGIGWDKIKERGFKRSWFIATTLTLLGLVGAVRFGHLVLNAYHLKIFAPMKTVLDRYLYLLFHIKPLVIFYRSSDIFSPDFIPATVFIIISILILYLLYASSLSRRFLDVVVPGVILINLLTAHPTYRQMVSADVYNYVPQTVTSIRQHSKSTGDLPFRVFVYRRDLINEQLVDKKLTSNQKWIVLSETLTPNVNMYYGLESVEGYDNFAPTRYEKFLSPAVAPPERGILESESEAYARLSAQINLLSFMNVKYIISPIALVHDDLVQIESTIVPGAQLRLSVYFNTTTEERIRWVDASSLDTIVLNDKRSGRYDYMVTTDRKQSLILAESFLPGWRATIDGSPVAIDQYNEVFQSIEVAPGTHKVLWEYLGI